MTTLLRAEDVHVTLGETSVLRGLNLTLDEGEHTLVMGPSGAGKTTLLNVLARLIVPDTGRLTFRGTAFAASGSPARFRQAHVGLLLQDFHLLETLSVADNIGLIQAALGAPKDAPSPAELLEPLGLGGRLRTPASALSRGERQRVALARAFAHRPALVLADEPTSSLDPSLRSETMAHLWHLADQGGATVMVVSHDEALARDPHIAHALTLTGGALRPASNPATGPQEAEAGAPGS